ncbi:cupin domain-containing protein [Allosphingosinicella indica]|uniref:Iron-binding zinc finger CDGSH type n=1 Tax=Allosphingosinicella indica TaxID=941907 RepID=A0A1X7FYE6_9SPHN|nr:cupin domain-containing protein [Allosphingosinicella indica]SMF60928.1 Iron-binding zinc finger CDGSH type [Allosphingosinicella indica]
MTGHDCSLDCPRIANRKPYYRELRAGRTYPWCACGRSTRQPFCDGRSHIGTGFEPVQYVAKADGEEVLFCDCKHTQTPPFCDGTHSNLPGGYEDDDTAAAGPQPPIVAAGTDGFARLDGCCFVVSPPDSGDRYQLSTLVAPSLGAQHQSQFHLRLTSGASPVLSARGVDAILWVRSGNGEIEIGERRFALSAPCGVYVRAGEAFRVHAATALTAYVSACPAVEALDEQADMPPHFDQAWPERVVPIDEAGRTAMGPRWFQMLVDKRIGSTTAAQFIGHIPTSRAEMHRHLYEEALVILSGEGIIWNEGSAARVRAGDVIFFPRKHLHALECTAPEGMDVVGLIHPGDNPGINY